MAAAHAGPQKPGARLPLSAGAQPSQGYQNGSPFHALHQVLRHMIYIIVIAPFRTSYMPVEHLLNAPNAPEFQHSPQSLNILANETRDQLTSRWRESKLSELSFVGLT
ncbi:hypothetical protein MMC28_009007, partial [Mycoblastus sanguinarius]|nr:hypothetical protein [Mycoblastus sanguinarius]